MDNKQPTKGESMAKAKKAKCQHPVTIQGEVGTCGYCGVFLDLSKRQEAK